MQAPTRTVSTALLDFVFGEPLPAPEVIAQDTEQAWQEWLDVLADSAAQDGFEPTRPMQTH